MSETKKCSDCAEGYPQKCTCGGWVHAHVYAKVIYYQCDKCGGYYSEEAR